MAQKRSAAAVASEQPSSSSVRISQEDRAVLVAGGLTDTAFATLVMDATTLRHTLQVLKEDQQGTARPQVRGSIHSKETQRVVSDNVGLLLTAAADHDQSTHHSYLTSPASDVTIKLSTEVERHVFHVHKMTFFGSTYFDAFINSSNREQHITIDLPLSAFQRSATELDQFLQLLYHKLDHILLPLACAAGVHSFVKSWCGTGTVIDIDANMTEQQLDDSGLQAADVQNTWVVITHTVDGRFTIRNQRQPTLEMHMVLNDCQMFKSVALQESISEPVNWLTQLQIACHFGVPYLTKLFTMILVRLVRLGTQHLMLQVARVADECSVVELRAVCLAEMRQLEWHAFTTQLPKLSSQFVMELLLPAKRDDKSAGLPDADG